MILMFGGTLPLTWQLQGIHHLAAVASFLTNTLSPGRRAELMASKVYLSKTRRLLIIQSPVPPALQYLQCCKEPLLPAVHRPRSRSSQEPQFHLLRRDQEEEEEEEGSFITDQKTSLEVPESKHD